MTSMTVRQIAEICFFTLLSKDKKAQSQVIEEFYAPNCVFEDPLVSVNSSKSLLAQFSILSSLFKGIKAQPQCVLLSTEGTRDVVVMDSLLTFELYFLGCIQMRVITKFEFLNDKIIKQEDVWSVLDLLSRVPLAGFLYGWVRRLNGAITALAMTQMDKLEGKIKS